MSVIIRLQNLPWSANALDIRNFFRGLSIPEGGVHIVGGELGDAFIAFSTDEDARQAMMLNGGKIKEVQVKLHLSSRSEMHKVIEAARQTVPILTLAPTPIATPTPAPAPIQHTIPAAPPAPTIAPPLNPFSAALGNNSLNNFGIPGIGNPQEIPQPAVIELPPAQISPNDNSNLEEDNNRDEEKVDKRRERDKRRTRSHSRSKSRDRDRKDRKRDRRDRSRSRERRRRDRSRSREGRRDRKRDRNNRSRSRDRSPTRRPRDRRKSPSRSEDRESPVRDNPQISVKPFANPGNLPPQLQQMLQANAMQNSPAPMDSPRFNDPTVSDALSKMQELAKKRNPNAFQGDHNGGGKSPSVGAGRGVGGRGLGYQRDRRSRFASDDNARDCCVAIRNAPNHTSYGDVRRFFPFMIDKHGIKMINDNTGRRTGNIFVRFTEPRSKQLALQRKNNDLKGALVTVESLEDEAYEAAVDSFLPYRDDNEAGDADVTLADMHERARPPFSVLKLSDMPHYIKEHDIIKAFTEYSLLSITLIDCRLTRSKLALVQFAKPEEARLALERKERVAFNRRQPTIVPLSDEEFEKEKLANMPKNDIVKRPQVEEPPAVEEVSAPRDPRQRRQFEGSAPPAPHIMPQATPAAPFFVPFGQNFPAGQNSGFAPQPQAFPGGQFPGPQFSGFPGPANVDPRTAASNWANRPQFPAHMEPQPMAAPMKKPLRPSHDIEDEPLDCVLMKGLPRDATDRTIVGFLSDTGAVPARIHLMLDTEGLPSGDCFCEFRSTQEARLAATKHGHNLEGCRVTVDIVPRSVVEEALEGPKNEPPMREAFIGDTPQFYDSPMSRGGFNGRGGFDSPRGFRGRGGFDRGGFDRGGFERGGYHRGGFDAGRGFRGRGGFDRGSRGGFEGRGRGRGRGVYENGSRNVDDDPALEDFGAPGCVVSMENVPFRATMDEIMQFFSEFELTQDDIIRRYNERGQPTGDARVAFRTPFDAQRAVKTRHMDTIHDRRINLNIL